MPRAPSLPPPRPEVLAFLHACKENPADDTPRLVLADWLQDHGDEHDAARGDFIRVQCTLAGMPAKDPQHKALQKKAQELEAEHGDAWLGPLAAHRSSSIYARGFLAEFRRGLLAINLVAHLLLQGPLRALTETKAFAWVEELTLRNVGGMVDVLALFAPLAGLSGLRLPKSRNLDVPQLGKARTEVLVRSRHLANLTLLDLTGQGTSAGGTAAVVNSPHLRRLQTLILADNKIASKGAQALMASPYLEHLTLLDLRANRLTLTDREALRERFPHVTIRYS